MTGVETPRPEDEIVIRDGVYGTIGFKGDFLPITTDYAVTVKSGDTGEMRVESIIPGSLSEPKHELVDELLAMIQRLLITCLSCQRFVALPHVSGRIIYDSFSTRSAKWYQI